MFEVVGTPGYYTLNAFVYVICQIPRVLQKGGKRLVVTDTLRDVTIIIQTSRLMFSVLINLPEVSRLKVT